MEYKPEGEIVMEKLICSYILSKIEGDNDSNDVSEFLSDLNLFLIEEVEDTIEFDAKVVNEKHIGEGIIDYDFIWKLDREHAYKVIDLIESYAEDNDLITDDNYDTQELAQKLIGNWHFNLKIDQCTGGIHDNTYMCKVETETVLETTKVVKWTKIQP